MHGTSWDFMGHDTIDESKQGKDGLVLTLKFGVQDMLSRLWQQMMLPILPLPLLPNMGRHFAPKNNVYVYDVYHAEYFNSVVRFPPYNALIYHEIDM